MSNVAYVVCKETNAHKKLDFLFDLLSNTQETMKRYKYHELISKDILISQL